MWGNYPRSGKEPPERSRGNRLKTSPRPEKSVPNSPSGKSQSSGRIRELWNLGQLTFITTVTDCYAGKKKTRTQTDWLTYKPICLLLYCSWPLRPMGSVGRKVLHFPIPFFSHRQRSWKEEPWRVFALHTNEAGDTVEVYGKCLPAMPLVLSYHRKQNKQTSNSIFSVIRLKHWSSQRRWLKVIESEWSYFIAWFELLLSPLLRCGRL